MANVFDSEPMSINVSLFNIYSSLNYSHSAGGEIIVMYNNNKKIPRFAFTQKPIVHLLFGIGVQNVETLVLYKCMLFSKIASSLATVVRRSLSKVTLPAGDHRLLIIPEFFGPRRDDDLSIISISVLRPTAYTVQ